MLKRRLPVGERARQIVLLAFVLLPGLAGRASADEVVYTLHDVGSYAWGLDQGRVITQRFVGGQLRGGVWSLEEGFIDLGGPDGASCRGQAQGGGVVTGVCFPPGKPAQGFVWTADTGMVNIGEFVPYDVSEDGTEVVGVVGETVYPQSTHAIYWTAATGPLDIGNLGGPDPTVTAPRISNGMVEGASNPLTAYGSQLGWQSFVWTPTDGILPIGPLPGHLASIAQQIDYSQVVGISYGVTDGVNQGRGFSWTAAGGAVDLGDFGGIGGVWPQRVRGGEVVGGGPGFEAASGYPMSSTLHAFHWTDGEGLIDLQSPELTARGLARSFAVDVYDGHAVGNVATLTQTVLHPFVWTADTGMVDIMPCGWRQAQALNIDQQGNILGNGYGPDGVYRAFFLTPGRPAEAELTVPPDPLAIACPEEIHVCGGDGLVTYDALLETRGCGATVTCDPPSGSLFPLGTTTVVCTATDGAGNTATCTTAVVRGALGFDGFLPPIDDNGGTFLDPVRTFKLGSTIPIKFRTLSCDGTPRTDGPAPTVTLVKWTSATNSDPPIDASPTDAATEGDQARPLGSEWHFNASTAGLSKGIWQIHVTIPDGSTESVVVQLR